MASMYKFLNSSDQRGMRTELWCHELNRCWPRWEEKEKKPGALLVGMEIDRAIFWKLYGTSSEIKNTIPTWPRNYSYGI